MRTHFELRRNLNALKTWWQHAQKIVPESTTDVTVVKSRPPQAFDRAMVLSGSSGKCTSEDVQADVVQHSEGPLEVTLDLEIIKGSRDR